MPGEHFILGVMTECCRYFYGAMLPDCNFTIQTGKLLKFAELNDGEHMILNS